MIQLLATVREVKECFVLANALKSGPFTSESFRAKAALERQRLNELSGEQLDREVTDANRLRRFDNGNWEFTVVELDSCSVWPHMGQRNWATGPVGHVAAQFENCGDSTDSSAFNCCGCEEGVKRRPFKN